MVQAIGCESGRLKHATNLNVCWNAVRISATFIFTVSYENPDFSNQLLQFFKCMNDMHMPRKRWTLQQRRQRSCLAIDFTVISFAFAFAFIHIPQLCTYEHTPYPIQINEAGVILLVLKLLLCLHMQYHFWSFDGNAITNIGRLGSTSQQCSLYSVNNCIGCWN